MNNGNDWFAAEWTDETVWGLLGSRFISWNIYLLIRIKKFSGSNLIRRDRGPLETACPTTGEFLEPSEYLIFQNTHSVEGQPAMKGLRNPFHPSEAVIKVSTDAFPMEVGTVQQAYSVQCALCTYTTRNYTSQYTGILATLHSRSGFRLYC